MSGSGTTTIGTGVTLTMATYATKNLSRMLVNNGKVQHSAGYLQFAGNGTLVNSAGKTYNLKGTANLYCIGSNNTINNAGSFNVQTDQDPEFHGVFNSSGSLNIFTGVFHIDGGGTNTGARNIAEGAILTYRADYTHGAGSTSGGTGILVFNGGNADDQRGLEQRFVCAAPAGDADGFGQPDHERAVQLGRGNDDGDGECDDRAGWQAGPGDGRQSRAQPEHRQQGTVRFPERRVAPGRHRRSPTRRAGRLC
jgi:hypothetical protein